MSIEFTCPACGKLLRTGDETAGQPARCPACSTVSTVPGAAPDAVPATLVGWPPEAAPLPPSGAASGDDPGNPYQSPLDSSPLASDVAPGFGPLRDYALSRVSAPSILLMVTGGLAVLQWVGLASLYFGLALFMPDMPQKPPSPGVEPRMAMAIAGGMFLMPVIPAALIIFGAVRMLRLRSYGWAMAAAILAMIPCLTGSCMLIGIPAGIWSLVAIHNPGVRPFFRS